MSTFTFIIVFAAIAAIILFIIRRVKKYKKSKSNLYPWAKGYTDVWSAYSDQDRKALNNVVKVLPSAQMCAVRLLIIPFKIELTVFSEIAETENREIKKVMNDNKCRYITHYDVTMLPKLIYETNWCKFTFEDMLAIIEYIPGKDLNEKTNNFLSLLELDVKHGGTGNSESEIFFSVNPTIMKNINYKDPQNIKWQTLYTSENIGRKIPMLVHRTYKESVYKSELLVKQLANLK